MIETSVSISPDLIRSIRSRAEALDIDISLLCRSIISRMVRRARSGPVRSSVQYQPRSRKRSVGILHLSLPYELYVQCLDCRLVFKRSVSRLFAEEVLLTLDKIVQELLLGQSTVNYKDHHHVQFYITPKGYRYQVYSVRKPAKPDP